MRGSKIDITFQRCYICNITKAIEYENLYNYDYKLHFKHDNYKFWDNKSTCQEILKSRLLE